MRRGKNLEALKLYRLLFVSAWTAIILANGYQSNCFYILWQIAKMANYVLTSLAIYYRRRHHYHHPLIYSGYLYLYS